ITGNAFTPVADKIRARAAASMSATIHRNGYDDHQLLPDPLTVAGKEKMKRARATALATGNNESSKPIRITEYTAAIPIESSPQTTMRASYGLPNFTSSLAN